MQGYDLLKLKDPGKEEPRYDIENHQRERAAAGPPVQRSHSRCLYLELHQTRRVRTQNGQDRGKAQPGVRHGKVPACLPGNHKECRHKSEKNADCPNGAEPPVNAKPPPFSSHE